ncbi:hypothetical protein [Phyllobacterium bourgognense]|uniref:Uncharacterized protein n=1 Tax=Phyllobacterium bourgognense TaxID=314236 RepID=A0A368YED0_9HYPH|nr:hypothetical protein [Phyllobacterium bourgognense]RCW77696.1 hypothetical protein C7476_1393 [Phyllobacterium bourgognense]
MRILLVIVFTLFVSQPNAQAQNQNPPPQDNKSQRYLLPVEIIENDRDAADRRDLEKRSAQHDADDLAAQRQAAEAAARSATTSEAQLLPIWLQVAIGVIGTGALLWNLYYIRLSTTSAVAASEAALAANAIAQQHFIADQRPWLSVIRKPAMSIYTENGSQSLGVLVEVENVGKSPCISVTADMNIEYSKCDRAKELAPSLRSRSRSGIRSAKSCFSKERAANHTSNQQCSNSRKKPIQTERSKLEGLAHR